ncbi:ABC transporter permease [candidate division NPL-UPA2 bacterium]|nr:ABC transporter permease [candidate division NPL-UPA2 bacterium]
MRKIPTLFYREFRSMFFSPIAYIVLTLFLVVSGYFFSMVLHFTREASLRFTLHNMAFVLLFISPMLTMRLLAEERKSGTIETLMTDPVTDMEVVLSKFFAVLSFYLIILAPTLLYVVILKLIGNPDFGPILSGYLGLILIGCVFLSIGLFASSLTKNQIVSAVISLVILLLLWVIGWASDISKVAGYLSLFEHFEDFRKGVIDTRNIIYYLSTCVLFLFLTVRVVEARKWR